MSVLCCGCLQSQERAFLTPTFLLAETWEAKGDVAPSNSVPLKRATLKSSSMPQILSASFCWDSLHMAGNLIYWNISTLKEGWCFFIFLIVNKVHEKTKWISPTIKYYLCTRSLLHVVTCSFIMLNTCYVVGYFDSIPHTPSCRSFVQLKIVPGKMHFLPQFE